MKNLLLSLFACSVVTTASADAEPWMKRKEPNGLPFVTFVSETCGVSQERVDETVSGVLIRSRIKKIDFSESPNRFGLGVTVECMKNKTAFAVQSDFIEMRETGLGFDRRGIGGYLNFGTFGGDGDYLLDVIKLNVERAVTDYLKANFDL